MFFEKNVKIDGRTIFRDNIRYLGYSATAVSFSVKGTKAQVDFISDPEDFLMEQQAWVAVYINDGNEPSMRVALGEKEQKITVFEAEKEETVTIKIMKYSEPEYAVCGIRGIEIEGELLAPPSKKDRQIQVIGDSITCGYGVEGSLEEMLHRTITENPTKAYAYLAAKELDAELEIVAWNGKGVITGYRDEGEEDTKDTSWLVPMLYEYTDAGLEKQYFGKEQQDWERWDPENLVPDFIMVHLGTNDASYTLEKEDRNREYAEAYKAFLDTIHKKNPSAKILCMLGMMDQKLCSTIEKTVEIYREENKDVEISYLQLPLQLEEEGFGTFWHPTYETNIRAAKAVVDATKKMTGW